LLFLVSIDLEEYAKLNSEKPDHIFEKYFDYYITDDIGEKKGNRKARCRLCQAELARSDGSTRSMKNHLKGPHKEFNKLYEAARQKLGLQRERLSHTATSGNQ
jgi:hypothetical protein